MDKKNTKGKCRQANNTRKQKTMYDVPYRVRQHSNGLCHTAFQCGLHLSSHTRDTLCKSKKVRSIAVSF